MMRACTTASGGVMFIQDNVENKSKSVSYSDLTEEKSEKTKSFGKRKALKTPTKKAA